MDDGGKDGCPLNVLERMNSNDFVELAGQSFHPLTEISTVQKYQVFGTIVWSTSLFFNLIPRGIDEGTSDLISLQHYFMTGALNQMATFHMRTRLNVSSFLL